MNNPQYAHKNVITVDQAKEYDHYILIDQSGSMGSPSTKMQGKSRWQEAQEFTEGYARFAEQVDDDGLTVITFNSSCKVYDGVKADKVTSIFANSPMGSTNLAAALEAAFKKKFSGSKKAIMMVLTDGSPDDRQAVIQSIERASNKLDRDEELAIQFIQIGDDSGAKQFLAKLDDDLKGKFDIVNSLTREEAESLTIEELLWQALND